MRVRVRDVLPEGCSSVIPNKLGSRMTGQKNRRKINPATEVYLSIPWSPHFLTTSLRMFSNTQVISLKCAKKEQRKRSTKPEVVRIKVDYGGIWSIESLMALKMRDRWPRRRATLVSRSSPFSSRAGSISQLPLSSYT